MTEQPIDLAAFCRDLLMAPLEMQRAARETTTPPFAAKKPCRVCGGRIAAPVLGHPGYCSHACVHEFYGTTESDTP